MINIEKITMTAQKDDYVTLAAALKFSGLCTTGGEAKNAILSGIIKINNESCTQRGKKIRTGDIISMGSSAIEVTIDDCKPT